MLVVRQEVFEKILSCTDLVKEFSSTLTWDLGSGQKSYHSLLLAPALVPSTQELCHNPQRVQFCPLWRKKVLSLNQKRFVFGIFPLMYTIWIKCTTKTNCDPSYRKDQKEILRGGTKNYTHLKASGTLCFICLNVSG